MTNHSLRTSLATALLSTIACGACAVDAPGDPSPPGFTVEAATVCEPRVTRYPVAGPHNHGYDGEALVFTCDASRSNSDFYRGSGDMNHPDGHLGNDVFAARGTPVVVARDGVVDEVATTAIGGNTVTIRDSCGWYYYYAHLDAIDRGAMVLGRFVAAGTPVGTVGNTGQARAGAPHLHFSVFPGDYDRGVDPFPMLRAVEPGACTGGGGGACPPRTDFWYCTGSNTQRRCRGGAWEDRSCPGGCQSRPVGEDDVCLGASSCPPATDYWYCPPGVDDRQRRCRDGRWEDRACPGGCERRPAGQDDVCRPAAVTCASATLGRDVVDGTCVQRSSDRRWFRCSAAGWVEEPAAASVATAAGVCSTRHPL